MKLQRLQIAEYRQLADNYAFTESGPFDAIFRQLYGSLNVTVLVGANGSGKTALMSFVASIFHNIERFQSRIGSDFTMEYEHGGHEVKISKSGPTVTIESPGVVERKILDEWDPSIRRHDP